MRNSNKAIPLPSQQELRDMFYYDSDGYLIWRIKPAKNINIGDRAGSVNKRGYTHIRIDGVLYLTHRLIFKFIKGDFDSDLHIDHIDGNTRNNRIENLQAVTHRENLQKQKKYSNNNSGLVGVHYMKDRKLKNPWLGYYRDESGKQIQKYFNNKFAAYHFHCENSIRVMGKFYKEKQLSTEDRHVYMDWLIEETDKENQDLFKIAA